MGGPGGIERARVSVRIVPDSTGFNRELAGKLRAIESRYRADPVVIRFQADLDTARVESRINRLRSRRITIPARVNLDTTAARARLAALRRTRVTIRSAVDRNSLGRNGADGGSFWGEAFTRHARKAIALGITASLPAITGLGNSLGVALQASAGLPALMTALAGAAGAAAFAFIGLGDATGKAATQARSALAGMSKAMGGLQKSIQAQVLPAFTSLVKTWSQGATFNAFSSGMQAQARGLAGAFRELDAASKNTTFISNLRSALTQLAPATQSLGSSLGSLARAFVAFAAGAAPTAVRWLQNLADAMATFASWSERMAANGSIDRWATQGGAAIASLSRSLANVAVGIKNVFAAGQSSGEFLAGFERISAAFRDITGSAQGQKAMSTVFDGIQNALNNTIKVLKAWGPLISEVVTGAAQGFALVGNAIAEVLTRVGNFTQGFSQLSRVSDVVAGIVTALAVVRAAMIAASVATALWTAATVAWNAAAAVFSALIAVIRGLIVAVRMAIMLTAFAQWALNAAMLANPIGVIIIAIVALIAIIVALWKNAETVKAALIAGWAMLKSAASAAWGWISSFIATAWASIRSAVMSAASSVRSAVVNAWNSIRATTAAAWASIRAAVTGAVNGVRAAVTAAVNSARAAVTSAWNSARATTTSAWAAIRSAVTSAVNGVRSAITSGMNSARSAVTNGFSSALSAARGFVGSFRSVGTSIAQGIAQGIMSAAGKIAQAAANVVKNAISAARAAVSINSPSRVAARDVGEPIGIGVKVGVDDTAPRVSASLKNAVTGAVQAAASTIGKDGIKIPLTPQLQKLMAEEKAAKAKTNVTGQQLTMANLNVSKEQKKYDAMIADKRKLEARATDIRLNAQKVTDKKKKNAMLAEARKLEQQAKAQAEQQHRRLRDAKLARDKAKRNDTAANNAATKAKKAREAEVDKLSKDAKTEADAKAKAEKAEADRLARIGPKRSVAVPDVFLAIGAGGGYAQGGLTINGNVGWDADEAARRMSVYRQRELAVGGFA